MIISTPEIQYHRNGVSGEGFFAIRFVWAEGPLEPPFYGQPTVGSCYVQEGAWSCGLSRFHEGPHSFEGVEQPQKMMAVVFLPEFAHGEDGYMTDPATWPFHNCKVAVFDETLLPDVRFFHNSWRGDNFAPDLYRALYERALSLRGKEHV